MAAVVMTGWRHRRRLRRTVPRPVPAKGTGDWAQALARLTHLVARPWAAAGCAAVVAGTAAVVAGTTVGPAADAARAAVGGGLAAVYGGLGAYLAARVRVGRLRRSAETAALDAVSDLAAELRAGASPAAAVGAAAATVSASATAADAVRVAWLVSERTGAPLAVVLDRVHVELRQSMERQRVAAAHSAGTRATALLLAVLPVAGLGVGYGMGADPLALLLGTPVGAVCAGTACALQLVGLGWTYRLSRVDPR